MSQPSQTPEPPTLRALFLCFVIIGMQSFGGGLSAWMRREIVQRRQWMADPQFLSGLALAQIAPGANAVNLCVFIGTTLHGGIGALVALAGLMGLPIILVLAAGAAYGFLRHLPGLQSALAGMGAAAIGLTLATGWGMMQRNVRGLAQHAIMLATAISIGVLGWPLLPVLLVVVPASLLLTIRRD